MKDHSILVDQARHNTSVVDSVTVNTSAKFYKTNFPSNIIFTKSDASTSDEKIEKLTR